MLESICFLYQQEKYNIITEKQNSLGTNILEIKIGTSVGEKCTK